jgi:hypothetical protein
MIEGLGAAEIALFLVRIFGAEAREIAEQRLHLSEQAAEWRLVALEIERLLSDHGEVPPRADSA